VKKIITTTQPFASTNAGKWEEHFIAAREMLNEAGVIIEEHESIRDQE
jgi:hypothetical protein